MLARAASSPSRIVPMSLPHSRRRHPLPSSSRVYSRPMGTVPQGSFAAAATAMIRSIAARNSGWSYWPTRPSDELRSAGPMNRRSTSGTRAIASTLARASAFSIWIAMNVSRLHFATYSA